jgi:hypothetical protein
MCLLSNLLHTGLTGLLNSPNVPIKLTCWRYDTRHNDTQRKHTQQNDIQHNDGMLLC